MKLRRFPWTVPLLFGLSACASAAAFEVETPRLAAAGPLTQRNLPNPSGFGAGWGPRSFEGEGDDHARSASGRIDAESVARESKSEAGRRDPTDLMAGLAPVGCPQAAVNVELPRPAWALQRNYAGLHGAPGVVVAMHFLDPREPAIFLDRLEAQMRACPAMARVDGSGPARLSFARVRRAGDGLWALRQESGSAADPNRYLAVLVWGGDRVGLAYLAGESYAQAPAVATQLRRAIMHG